MLLRTLLKPCRAGAVRLYARSGRSSGVAGSTGGLCSLSQGRGNAGLARWFCNAAGLALRARFGAGGSPRGAVVGGGVLLARGFRAGSVLRHGEAEAKPAKNPEDVVRFSVVDREGTTHQVQGKVGDNLMYLMHHLQESDPILYLEGSCEASLACSTCHVILDEATFDKLPEAEEREEDLLDEAACLTFTSRLGCQIELGKELEGMTITLPKFSKNFYVDGHVPEPH